MIYLISMSDKKIMELVGNKSRRPYIHDTGHRINIHVRHINELDSQHHYMLRAKLFWVKLDAKQLCAWLNNLVYDWTL